MILFASRKYQLNLQEAKRRGLVVTWTAVELRDVGLAVESLDFNVKTADMASVFSNTFMWPRQGARGSSSSCPNPAFDSRTVCNPSSLH